MVCETDPAADSRGSPDLHGYDRIIYGYSGGKDSLAGVLDLLERGVPRDKIELWHQHVDGEPGSHNLMDWPITESYVRATGKMLGISTRFQWREGGFRSEMLRQDQPTGDVCYEAGEEICRLESNQSKKGTRLKFPQVSADLKVRWCSAYLKIDVAARVINNDPRFMSGRFLYCTGERRQESASRAKYREFETHRCHSSRRHVDHYRNVIDWDETQIWNVIRRWRIRPHPAYWIGFSRVSCMACIFGRSDQWATVRKIARRNFDRVATFERLFGATIHRSLEVGEQADRGTPYPAADDPELVALAMSENYPDELFFVPDSQSWAIPPGAFKGDGCGPS